MTMQAEVTVLQSPATHTLAGLARIAAEPLRRSGAERAIAFGSYARGTADGYSDLDLVVVLRTDLPPAERWPLLRELLDALPVSVDLLVYTPEEFALGMERRIGIFDAIVREGVVLYARPGS
jgi:predicted nucleotidyltransferase